MKKLIIGILVFVVLLGGTGYWYWDAQAATRTVFRFEEVTKGRLVSTISSTGTVQAQDVTDVGAQVAGRIIKIGTDKDTKTGIVDWGSVVKGPIVDKDGKVIEAGTLLAQIDPALYKAQELAAQASLAGTNAALLAAQADLEQKSATLRQAEKDWKRAESLWDLKKPKNERGIAEAEYDQAEANIKVATALVKASNANIAAAKANIAAAEANLVVATTNLDYTKITAPVTGVVVDRRVNVGQTVVASLSAPSLFLIAKDLSKMEVWATVNEVDVSRIEPGMKATFAVDSIAGKTFKGHVVPQGNLAYRLNATMNQNVVTYTVVVSVDNFDAKLKPYMTTNLTFIIDDKKDVLQVPNATLRWQPAKEQIDPEVRDEYFKSKGRKRLPSDPEGQERGFVWVKADDSGYVRYLELKLGISDSVKTEVLGVVGGGDLPEKTQLIVGEGKAGSRTGGTNPFSIQMFKKKE